MPEQVQDFYPTPSTISTCMYYTGLDPRTMEPVYVPKNPHEKAMQRALMQYRQCPKTVTWCMEALETGSRRTDLIGYGPKCLIRPENTRAEGRSGHTGRNACKRENAVRSGKKKTIRNVHKKKS